MLVSIILLVSISFLSASNFYINKLNVEYFKPQIKHYIYVILFFCAGISGLFSLAYLIS
jgi:hypothetical protein